MAAQHEHLDKEIARSEPIENVHGPWGRVTGLNGGWTQKADARLRDINAYTFMYTCLNFEFIQDF